MADLLSRKSLLVAAGWLAVYPPVMPGQGPAAQAPAAPGWQIAAGSKMAFEVASVKRDPGPFRPPNFALDPGDGYRPVGGRFSADFPRTTYITFSGRFDFSIEWPPESNRPSIPNADAPADPQGPAFLEALREQLGLKLESTRAPIRMLVVDHVERPSEN
jgi:hypothetical protein